MAGTLKGRAKWEIYDYCGECALGGDCDVFLFFFEASHEVNRPALLQTPPMMHCGAIRSNKISHGLKLQN